MTRLRPHDEDAIARELVRLRVEVPFPVDVADRVLARIGTGPRPRRREVTVRDLGWALAAAASVAAVVGTGLASRLDAVRAALAELAGWSYRVGRATLDLCGPIAGAVRGAGRAGRVTIDALWDYVANLQTHDQAVLAASLVAVVAMAATAFFFVGRDLRGRLATKER